MSACKQEIHFLARKSLLETPLLGFIFPKINVVPVDRDGADMTALKTIIRVLKTGGRTVIFPEGTRTRDGNLQPAKPGVGLIVAKARVPVIPMRIFGANLAFPRTAKFPRPHPITLVVGEPMRFDNPDSTETGRDSYQKIADAIMTAIAAIELPESERKRFGSSPV